MAKFKKEIKEEIKESIAIPDYQQSITVVDFIDTLKLSANKRIILKMTYAKNKELHTVGEWVNIIKI